MGFLVKPDSSASKHRLTPHLTSYTPPYTFSPFLNPPKISTPQNTKTRSTPQLTIKQIEQPKTQSTYQHNTKSQYTNKIKTTSVPHTSTLQNPKHKAPPNTTPNPKTQNKIKTTSFPHTSHPILPPTLSTHFSTRLTNQPLNPSKHKAPPNNQYNNPENKATHQTQYNNPKHNPKPKAPKQYLT